jgi:hypothetical protein
MNNRERQIWNSLCLLCFVVCCFIKTIASACAPDPLENTYDYLKRVYQQGQQAEGNAFADHFMMRLPCATNKETMWCVCWLAQCFMISGQPERVKNLSAAPFFSTLLKDCSEETYSVFPYIAWSAILHVAGFGAEAEESFHQGCAILKAQPDWLFILSDRREKLMAYLDCFSSDEFLDQNPSCDAFMQSRCLFVRELKRDLSARES